MKQGKIYAIIDTNVFVSAFITRNKESPVVKILNLIRAQKIIPIVSKEIVEEYKQVLSRPKFKIEPNHVEDFIEYILSISVSLSDLIPLTEILPDPKDIVFYAVTISSQDKKSILITGNTKHFPVKNFVLTPSVFMQRYSEKTL